MHNVVKFMVSSSASGLEFKSEILTPLEDFNSDEAALNIYSRVIQDTVETVGAELKPLLAMLQARAEHNTNEPIEASFVITLTENDDTITYELSTVKESDEATPAAFIAATVTVGDLFVPCHGSGTRGPNTHWSEAMGRLIVILPGG